MVISRLQQSKQSFLTFLSTASDDELDEKRRVIIAAYSRACKAQGTYDSRRFSVWMLKELDEVVEFRNRYK